MTGCQSLAIFPSAGISRTKNNGCLLDWSWMDGEHQRNVRVAAKKAVPYRPVRRFQTCKDDGGNVTRIAGHCISIHCTDDSDVNTKITLDLVERSIPLRNGRGSGRVNCKALPQSSASGKHPSLPHSPLLPRRRFSDDDFRFPASFGFKATDRNMEGTTRSEGRRTDADDNCCVGCQL